MGAAAPSLDRRPPQDVPARVAGRARPCPAARRGPGRPRRAGTGSSATQPGAPRHASQSGAPAPLRRDFWVVAKPMRAVRHSFVLPHAIIAFKRMSPMRSRSSLLALVVAGLLLGCSVPAGASYTPGAPSTGSAASASSTADPSATPSVSPPSVAVASPSFEATPTPTATPAPTPDPAVTKLQHQVADLQKQVAALQKSLAAEQKTTSPLPQQIKTIQGNVASLKSAIAALGRRIDRCQLYSNPSGIFVTCPAS